jgi:hypothetical protein
MLPAKKKRGLARPPNSTALKQEVPSPTKGPQTRQHRQSSNPVPLGLWFAKTSGDVLTPDRWAVPIHDYVLATQHGERLPGSVLATSAHHGAGIDAAGLFDRVSDLHRLYSAVTPSKNTDPPELGETQ